MNRSPCQTLTLLNKPNTLSNQNIRRMTTTIFKMDLIFLSIGIYVLISQRTSPATTSVIIIVRIGKIDSFMMSSKDQG